MKQLPTDPNILLSFVNTQLRDYYPSLGQLADAFGVSTQEILDPLRSAGYEYDPDANQFT